MCRLIRPESRETTVTSQVAGPAIIQGNRLAEGSSPIPLARHRRSKSNLKFPNVKQWSQYLRLIDQDYRNWAFRGHARADWTLVPTITRELQNRHVNPRYWLKQEHRDPVGLPAESHSLLSNPPQIGDTQMAHAGLSGRVESSARANRAEGRSDTAFAASEVSSDEGAAATSSLIVRRKSFASFARAAFALAKLCGLCARGPARQRSLAGPHNARPSVPENTRG